MTDAILLLALWVGLELVLGVDNVLVIAVFAGRLPETLRRKARLIGLSLALAIMVYAKPVGDFILDHPALKILALSFLITIGVTIFMEGLHQHVPKAYIYLPMGFALLVELLQMRYEKNRKVLRL
jgi:predicted tellurium resistance membrane protein TerC